VEAEVKPHRHQLDEGGRATAVPSAARTVLGMLAIAACVALAIINIIAWASARGDDVQATRRAVETIKPCRP
jgi:hypothetical protein